MGARPCDMAGVGGCAGAVASRCFCFPFLGSWGDSRLGWPSLGSLVLTGANWKPWKPFRRRMQSMAGAGQWAGPLPPAPLLHHHRGQPPVVCAGRAGTALVWGGSGPGSLFLRKGEGQQPGVAGWSRGSLLQASSSVTAAPEWCPGGGSCSLGPIHRGSGNGPHGDCVPARGGSSGLPLPLSTPGQKRHLGMPVMPRFVWGPQGHLGGSEEHFLCTQATVSSALGCSGQRSLATCGVQGEPSVSCPRSPPALHPACATAAAKPSPVPPTYWGGSACPLG